MIRSLEYNEQLLFAFLLASNAMSASSRDRKQQRSKVELERVEKALKSSLNAEFIGEPLPRNCGPSRKIHGKLVDPQGRPIPAALVVFAMARRQINHSYVTTFDLTDDLGRFVVQGLEDCLRIVVFHEERTQSYPVPDEEDFVVAHWPELASSEIKTIDESESVARRRVRIVFGLLPTECLLYTAAAENGVSSFLGYCELKELASENGEWSGVEVVSEPLPAGNYQFLSEHHNPSPSIHVPLDSTYGRITHVVLTDADVSHNDSPLLIDLRCKDNVPPRQRVHRCMDALRDDNWSLRKKLGLNEICDQEPDCLKEVFRIARDQGAYWKWKQIALSTIAHHAANDENVLPILAAELDSSCRANIGFVFEAMERLDFDSLQKFCPAVVQRFDEPDRYTRWLVLWSIEMLGNKQKPIRKEFSACMIAALEDPYSDIRQVAARAIGEWEIQAALSELKRHADSDVSPEVRAWCAWASWKLNRDRDFALSVLKDQLLGADMKGMGSAAQLIRDFDDVPEVFLERLKELENFAPPPPHPFDFDEALQIRHNAKYSLKEIREKQA